MEIIRKVWRAKRNNQKLVTIPNDVAIEEGDFVRIKKINVEKE